MKQRATEVWIPLATAMHLVSVSKSSHPDHLADAALCNDQPRCLRVAISVWPSWYQNLIVSHYFCMHFVSGISIIVYAKKIQTVIRTREARGVGIIMISYVTDNCIKQYNIIVLIFPVSGSIGGESDGIVVIIWNIQYNLLTGAHITKIFWDRF